MTESEENKELPILEKIQKAGKYLGVSRREIAKEITRLSEEKDVRGMQNLFKAYEDWELKSRKPGVSDEQVEELAKRNFDIVAQVADGFRLGVDDYSATFYAYNSEGKPPGKITAFYRKSVDYNPHLEKSQNN